jgi:hypothetical protein
MNIALEQTEELVEGKVRNKYGDSFIRGNNGNFVLFSKSAWSLTKTVFSVVHHEAWKLN